MTAVDQLSEDCGRGERWAGDAAVVCVPGVFAFSLPAAPLVPKQAAPCTPHFWLWIFFLYLIFVYIVALKKTF